MCVHTAANSRPIVQHKRSILCPAIEPDAQPPELRPRSEHLLIISGPPTPHLASLCSRSPRQSGRTAALWHGFLSCFTTLIDSCATESRIPPSPSLLVKTRSLHSACNFSAHAPLTFHRTTLNRRAGRWTKTSRSKAMKPKGGAARLRPSSEWRNQGRESKPCAWRRLIFTQRIVAIMPWLTIHGDTLSPNREYSIRRLSHV
jgi:hypothetical protein